MGAALATPKLSAVMSLLFVALSIPILIFILLYNLNKTSAAIMSNLHEQVAKTRLASIEDAQNLINPVATALRLLSGAAASDPALFRTEQSRELLYRALTSAEQIDAVYVSFEDGYHRVVTRVDDDRRRSDPKIPPMANWHSSFIDDFPAGKNRRRHRTFFDAWPNVVARYDAETTVDIRILPHYKAAKSTGSLAVTEPSINPDTGYPVLSLGFPILRDDKFVGFAGANITLNLCRASSIVTAPVLTARRPLWSEAAPSSPIRTPPSRSRRSTASSPSLEWQTSRTTICERRIGGAPR